MQGGSHAHDRVEHDLRERERPGRDRQRANTVTIRNSIIAFGSLHGITLAVGSTATSTTTICSATRRNWNGLASGTGDFSLEPTVDPNGADNSRRSE